jgi:hypothetical protein
MPSKILLSRGNIRKRRKLCQHNIQWQFEQTVAQQRSTAFQRCTSTKCQQKETMGVEGLHKHKMHITLGCGGS